MKEALLKLLEKHSEPGVEGNLASESFRQVLVNEIITIVNKEISGEY